MRLHSQVQAQKQLPCTFYLSHTRAAICTISEVSVCIRKKGFLCPGRISLFSTTRVVLGFTQILYEGYLCGRKLIIA
jgi:hypothetical protein